MDKKNLKEKLYRLVELGGCKEIIDISDIKWRRDTTQKIEDLIEDILNMVTK